MASTALDAAAERTANEFLEDAQRQVNLLFSPELVLPGDDVTATLTRTGKHVRLGAGLQAAAKGQERIVCTNAGVLRYRPPNRYWVEYGQKRYTAATDDDVVGVVVDRNAEFYRLNIGAASSATLGVLAFDGATKNYRPSLRVGSLVYARVLKTSKDSEPEVTCEAPASMSKKGWMTGQSIYGELAGGHVFKTSINLAKALLQDDNALLTVLGKHIAFEIAVGLNGIVWLNAQSAAQIVLVCNAILNAETMAPTDVEAMVKQMIASFEQR